MLCKNVSRIRKKTFYLQFCMGTPEGHQKSIFNTPKAQPKILKKIIEATNQNENFPKKTMFRTLKMKRSQKLV
jgi:hypothetical protein